MLGVVVCVVRRGDGEVKVSVVRDVIQVSGGGGGGGVTHRTTERNS